MDQETNITDSTETCEVSQLVFGIYIANMVEELKFGIPMLRMQGLVRMKFQPVIRMAKYINGPMAPDFQEFWTNL